MQKRDDGIENPAVQRWLKYARRCGGICGPGARWADVYASLHPHDLVVAGGRGAVPRRGRALILARDGQHVTSWPVKGFACDNVVALEVVLASDGRIV